MKQTPLELYNNFPLDIRPHSNPRHRSWLSVENQFTALSKIDNLKDAIEFVEENFYLNPTESSIYCKTLFEKEFTKEFVNWLK